MEKRSYLQGYLFVAIAGSLWAIGGFFVAKMSSMGVSSLITAFSGHFFAILPLLIYLLAKKGLSGLKISKKGLLYSVLLGVLSKGIDASKTTIVASVEVVIATVAGVLLLKEEINLVGYIGIIIMLGSILLMNNTIPNKNEKEVSEKEGLPSFESH